jgi:Mn-containing catalase
MSLWRRLAELLRRGPNKPTTLLENSWIGVTVRRWRRDRLKNALQLLGGSFEGKACKVMKGLVEESQETIGEGREKDEFTVHLALIAVAQRVEHCEISGYGTARSLARQIGEREVAVLLSHTLG